MARTKPLPIQVGTIVYNEKDRLPQWLKHWQKHAQRVIVLDQGSDDGTQDILNESGVTWFERLPRGNPDIHWNDLIAISKANIPIFRHGVDEFITRANLKKILKVMKAHPNIKAWWLARRNWIDGIDLRKHPEVKGLSIEDDWQLVISYGKAYSFNGRMHNWPQLQIPTDNMGYIDPDNGWIDHYRTMEEIERVNADRFHYCRNGSDADQDWFLRVCRDLVERYGDESK